MSSNEILKEACVWWMAFNGIILILSLGFLFQEKIEKIDPEDKFLRKVLGNKIYNFLKENL